jgi:hypothetical protein
MTTVTLEDILKSKKIIDEIGPLPVACHVSPEDYHRLLQVCQLDELESRLGGVRIISNPLVPPGVVYNQQREIL